MNLDLGFDREKIKEEFPWVSEENKKMVIGGDLDALLSATYLKDRKEWELIGFYTDFENLYYKTGEEDELEDAIWVDLDIYDSEIYSIGHHILKDKKSDELKGHKNSLNPNLLNCVTREDFWEKYPLGTIHFLLWLFDEDIDHSDILSKLLIWLPDSSWINGQKYEDNVKNWIINFIKLDSLKNTLDEIYDKPFEEKMRDELFPKIEKVRFKDDGQRKSHHLNLSGHQCSFSDPKSNKRKINELFELINFILDWDTPKIDYNLKTKTGNRHSVDYSNESLEDFLEGKNIFSYAFVYYKKINYTTDINI